MSSKQGSPDKRCAAKRTSDKGESSTPTQSPQKQYKHKRRRRNRLSSSSSDGIVHEAKRDLRHMERLLLHSGKLHVFRAYFDDPDLHFYTRPEGRKRHPAGARNRQPPDENRAIAALGMQQGLAEDVDNNPLMDRPQAVPVEDEGPPSVVSSRGISSVSSFATFPPSPPPQCNADFEMVPFEGLPPIREGPAAARPRPKPVSAASSSSADHDDYMASGSASDSDEPARQNMEAAVQVADRFNRMVVSGNNNNNNNPAPLPAPEPMSLSSDPATPRESD